MDGILKDRDIVSKILIKLSELTPIPDNGFLAGGAVANTLLSMKYGEEYPINDLDIFIELNESSPSVTSNGRSPMRTETLIIESGYFEGELSYDHGSNYRILEVDRDGLLNWITISRVIDRDNIRNYRYILNGFDFNCCQVGIDLKTNELYYTDEFEEFLNTKQLDITAVYTPAHTAIRLFKKKKELNCYCNVEKCMELLSQPLIREIRRKLNPTHFGTYFSHKYRDMFIEHYKELKEYFKLIRFFEDKKEMWKLNNPTISINISDNEDHISNWLNTDNSIPKETLETWANYNDLMWTLLPHKYNKPNKKINDILSTTVYNPLTFMGTYKLISGKLKKKLINKCEMVINKGLWTKLLTLLNPYYCNCDFSDEHVNIIERFLSKHPHVLGNITKYKLNLQENLNLIKIFNKIISVEGEWVEIKISEILSKGNTSIKPTYESINNTLQLYKKDMSKPLVDEIGYLKVIKLPKGVKV
jgi:predicted metalloenzyme YecM